MDKEKIENLSDEKVEQLFSELIREKMDTRQFLNWIKDWKDLSSICREAEQNWETESKRETIIGHKDLL